MKLEKTLVELKKVMESWGLDQSDWSLFLHFADILSGYDILYARDNHLHVMISIDKIPWKVNKKYIDQEVITPTGSKYEKDFTKFIKKTDWDFHILVGDKNYFKSFIKNDSLLYKVDGGKIRMATPLGNIKWLDIHMKKSIRLYSPEVVARRLTWTKLILQEAKRKKHKQIIIYANRIIKKYLIKSKKAENNRKVAEDFFEDSKNIKGQVAFKGKVSGKVLLVNSDKIIKNVKKNVILVSKLTSPKLVSQIKVSKAVITDEGGMLSHAAIFAREFKIPCIVGTQIATQILKDGDKVEVNAEKILQ